MNGISELLTHATQELINQTVSIAQQLRNPMMRLLLIMNEARLCLWYRLCVYCMDNDGTVQT